MSLQKVINEKHIFLFEKRARGICPQSRLILIKSVNVHMLTFLKNKVLNKMCPRSKTETIKYTSNKNCIIWKLEHVSNTFVNDTSVRKKNQKYLCQFEII